MAREEQKQKCMCGCDGSGSGCMCGWHHGHMLFRMLIGLIILVIVFWFGVKLGELRESIRGYGFESNSYAPVPMMSVYGSTLPGTTSSTK
jgi:hypothetical protein